MELKEKLSYCLSQTHDLVYGIEELMDAGSEWSADAFADLYARLDAIRDSLSDVEGLGKIDSDTAVHVQHADVRVDTVAAPQYLEDEIARKIYPNFRSGLSLNDRFRFHRDLFGGDDGVMDEALDGIDRFSSYDEAVSYLDRMFGWDWSEESADAFRQLLQKRYN